MVNKLSETFWRNTVAFSVSFTINKTEKGLEPLTFFKFGKKPDENSKFQFDKTIKMGNKEIGQIIDIIENGGKTKFYHESNDTQTNITVTTEDLDWTSLGEDDTLGIFTVSGDLKRNFVLKKGEEQVLKQILKKCLEGSFKAKAFSPKDE
ncbi:MAG: hypothetical protein ACOCP8_06330 [archaeon]